MTSSTVNLEEKMPIKTESLNNLKPDENIFTGKIKDKCPYTGHGKWTYPNGDKFIGSWLDGKWETGNGKHLASNGTYITNIWLNGKLLSKDDPFVPIGSDLRIIWDNGDHFTGDYEWHTGTGKKTYSNSDHFTGSWLNGKPQTGYGKLTLSNGGHYIGSWLNGKQQTGTLYTACKLENGFCVPNVASCKNKNKTK